MKIPNKKVIALSLFTKNKNIKKKGRAKSKLENLEN
jgi:hypothetical protein